MAVTVKLGNTEMVVGQSGGEILFNSGLRNLDVAVFPTVKDIDQTTPPGSPATGDAYIPASGATGDWAGEVDNIAYYDNGWKFITADEGMHVYVDDEDRTIYYDGTAWTIPRLTKLKVEAKTANYTVTVADVGKLFTNTGATGDITFTLPVAVVGLRYTFVVGSDTNQLRIDPDGTETISNPTSGVPGTGGKYLWADNVQESIELVCGVAGNWAVIGSTGTWTFEP